MAWPNELTFVILAVGRGVAVRQPGSGGVGHHTGRGWDGHNRDPIGSAGNGGVYGTCRIAQDMPPDPIGRDRYRRLGVRSTTPPASGSLAGVLSNVAFAYKVGGNANYPRADTGQG